MWNKKIIKKYIYEKCKNFCTKNHNPNKFLAFHLLYGVSVGSKSWSLNPSWFKLQLNEVFTKRQ